MYEARDQENILAELQSYSGLETSKIEGTFENDILASNSIEFAKVEVELEQAYKASFAETSWGEYLTMRAAEFGVDRKLATKATGYVTCQGTGTVPVGSHFTTTAGTEYVSTKEVVIDGNGLVPIEAVVAGTSGNATSGMVCNIPMNIPGITSATNETPIADGYNEESDTELLKRYYTVVRTPATSGNKYHYYNWAMSVDGVGDCRVLPLWNGNGTVKVIIVDSNHETATQNLMDKVAAYIEEQRPIGATVTISSPEPLTIDISADVKGTFDETTFRESMSAYFISRALSLDYLSSAQIIDKIMNQKAVEDCDNVTLNNASRVTIGLDKLPTIGTVTINALST